MADDTIYYVAKTGNDSNAGTSLSAPKLTIQDACDDADAGARNIVEIIDSGVYTEEIDIYGNAITVRATGSNKPTISGGDSNQYAFESNVSGNIYQGLTFVGQTKYPINGMATAGYNFILSGCVATYPGPQPIGKSGMAEIHNCRLLATNNDAINIKGASATVWINNSFVASNKAGHPVIEGYSGQATVTASYCTIVGSGHADDSGRFYQLVTKIYKVINCIISGSGDGINANESTYNLVHVSGQPFTVWSTTGSYAGTGRSAGTGEITGDPLFISGSIPGTVDPDVDGSVNLDTQNYALLVNTPAFNAGQTFAGVTTDISASTRAATPTIGAYEFFEDTPIWATFGTQLQGNTSADFTINQYSNLTANYQMRSAQNPKQVPFFLGVRGPISLRKDRAYTLTHSDTATGSA